MSDKLNITKLVFRMHLKETRRLKHRREFYKQPNQYVDYIKILNNKPIISTNTPIFDGERLENLKMKKANLNLEFLNKAPVSTIINDKRISANSNALIFNKIDPVRQIDSEISYSHYDTSIKIHNRRLIEKTARKLEKEPKGKKFYLL